MTRRPADDEKEGERIFQHAVEHSKVGGAVSRGVSMGARAMAGLAAVTRESFLYRWLTAEPEPDVVVIDLRETYMIGPLIRLVDAAVNRVGPYWETSKLKRSVDASVRALDGLAETRVGGFLAAILAPPEPPDSAKAEDEDLDEAQNADDVEEPQKTDDGTE